MAVPKEGLLPSTTSNMSMEAREQGRAFHSVESRATELYDKGYSSLKAELGYNQNLLF